MGMGICGISRFRSTAQQIKARIQREELATASPVASLIIHAYLLGVAERHPRQDPAAVATGPVSSFLGAPAAASAAGRAAIGASRERRMRSGRGMKGKRENAREMGWRPRVMANKKGSDALLILVAVGSQTLEPH